MSTSPPGTHAGTAAIVKGHIERLAISQKELATRLGVSKMTVSRWATGATRPDPRTLRLLGNMRRQVLVNATDLETVGDWFDEFDAVHFPPPKVVAAFKRLRTAAKRSKA